MYRIIKTELWKLKRYHIIWAGILLMLLSVGITLFASTALDGTVWTFPHLVERVIQNNTTTIFPMCITLIAGYIIAREKSDDTLKSIMTIPVSYPALIGGKLFVCGFLSVFLGMASTFFTVAAELLVGFPGFYGACQMDGPSVQQQFLSQCGFPGIRVRNNGKGSSFRDFLLQFRHARYSSIPQITDGPYSSSVHYTMVNRCGHVPSPVFCI